MTRPGRGTREELDQTNWVSKHRVVGWKGWKGGIDRESVVGDQ